MKIAREGSRYYSYDTKFCEKKDIGVRRRERFLLSTYEVVYLIEKYSAKVYSNNRMIPKNEILKNLNITNYIVYKDLKSKGYSVKSGMKYGFPFRVYAKGIKSGDDHSLWLVWPIDSLSRINVLTFIAKNRVAHTVKKRILLAFVDNEEEVNYYEVSWKRI